MARWARARWEPVSTCGPAGLRPIAVTLHHQAGNGNPRGVYLSRRVSAHFWIPKNGQPVQHVDTSVKAWHGVAHNSYSIGVETEGCGGRDEPLTENQLNLFAELMRWANQVHGIPLRLSEAVTQPGLNYHRCKGGPPTGCPCSLRVNARAEILRRAGGKPGTVAPPPTPPGKAPPFPGRLIRQGMSGNDVKTWQARMKARGWSIAVDGAYGPASVNVCRKFQGEKRLGVDGIIGPKTWAAAWTSPVT